MKTIRNFLAIVVFLLPALLNGQDQTPGNVKKGLTVSVQNTELGIMMPFWLTKKFILAPGFQFAYASKVGTDVVLGLSAKTFINDQNNFRPYWGIKAGVGYYDPEASDSLNQIDLILGAAIGVEYFFNPNFSIGIEPQLNLSISDDESNRFGNPGGTGLNTATMLTANIYF